MLDVRPATLLILGLLCAAAVGTTPASAASGVSAATCAVYERGTAVSLTFLSSDAPSACRQWISARGKLGEFWSLAGQPNEPQSLACIFKYKTGALVEIRDGGGQFVGQGLCAAFAGASGWSEDIPAEQSAQRQAHAAAAAQQRAQAKASAAQAAKNQLINDASTVSGDVQALRGDTAALLGQVLTSDLQGLQTDLAGVHTDLRGVLADGSDVVCGDAGVTANDEGVMENDVGVMNNDIGVNSNAITSVRSDIATVLRDQAAYAALSARLRLVATNEPSSTARTNAINAGKAAITKEQRRFAAARSQAAALVAQAKQYVAQAKADCTRRG